MSELFIIRAAPVFERQILCEFHRWSWTLNNGANIEYNETMNNNRTHNQHGGGIKRDAKGRTNVKREFTVEISDDQNVCIFAQLILRFYYFAQYCERIGF